MHIDGKVLADKYLQLLPKKDELRLLIVEVGNHPASAVFVRKKKELAEKLGIVVTHEVLDASVTEEELQEKMHALSQKKYTGVILQLPLPPHIRNVQNILDEIPKEQDVDTLRTGALIQYEKDEISFTPPLAFAVDVILKETGVILTDKNIVIIGKGKLVGLPIASYFKKRGITYTSIDINTNKNERDRLIKNADIIISGVGIPNMITPDMIKSGVILIDAGTSEQAGKITGDIDPSCFEKASFYTKTPGGVGPLTITGLFYNLLQP